MRACFFGTYNRLHPANRLLIRDLRAGGLDVTECHQPLWEKTRDKMPAFFSGPSLATNLLRYLRSAGALASRVRRLGRFDFFVAGFNGQLDMLLLKLLVRGRVPVVFAPLMSVTETVVEDRALFGASSVRGRLVRLFDRLSLRAADVVIADTRAHESYLREELGLGGRPMAVHYLGADEAFSVPPAAAREGGRARTVLFYGQYVPLHGTDVIVEAAAMMARRPDVCFHFIGTGPERPRVESRARALGARIEFEDWVEFSDLPARLAAASVCLGAFGGGRKADMVIPTKVYQAAAAGRAVVTSDTPAVREIFTGGRDICFCKGRDPEDLAAALEKLLSDDGMASRIGTGARELMRRRFSATEQGRSLVRGLSSASPELARGLG